MKPELREQARNKWPSILAHLGIESRFLRDRHGPCPICKDGRDRFRFDDKGGAGTWFCNVCRAGDGVDLLMKVQGWTFAETAERVREVLGVAVESKPKRELDPEFVRQARHDLWKGSVPIGNDEAAAYLAGRNIRGPYPSALRFCAAADVRGHPRKTRLPAMLALVSGPDGKPVQIHRTFLENARKASMPAPRQMMPGTVPEGAAIRLGAHDGRLGVAEGIETALMVQRRFGIMCWSLIDAGKMEKFIIPSAVRELHIFGDNDLKFGGQAAAYRLAHRAATMKDGPTVEVHIPTQPGTDWADVSQEKAA